MPLLDIPRRSYLTAVIVAGGAVIGVSLVDLVVRPVSPAWFVFAALTLLSGSATLRLPAAPIGFSISDTFTITAALLFGPSAGTAAVAIDSLAISLRLTSRPLPLRRILFNATAPALSMWVAAHLFFSVAGTGPLALHPEAIARVLGPLVLFATAYFVLNTGTIAFAIALDQHAAALPIWRAHFFDLWLSYFGGASVAALIIVLVFAPQHADFRMLALVLPLPVILYFAFKSVVDRLQQHLDHLDAVNRLNLSTVQTLAQAIDAKDQVTHGHLRRVQVHATRLAGAMGLAGENDIRALEVGALLHDVGKLAVPEHILNKPAPLTSAEYERMKQHVVVGAQILSSIDFPYPVIPIVRHHHERWDGRGYPDGLQGDAIPVGARILSVVDCFDALTSDRPYRPRLTDDAALDLLRQGRGTQFDPNVVDAFIAIYPALASDSEEDEPAPPAFGGLSEGALTGGAVDAPAADSSELATIAAAWELGSVLATRSDLEGTCDRLHALLERVMPLSTCVLYVLDAGRDQLVASAVSGQHAAALRGLTMKRGQRLSGWVAANRTSIVNSDAALDLGNLTLTLQPPPRTCLSVPLTVAADTAGVLTVYSSRPDAYDDRHRRLLEAIGARLAPSMRRPVTA